MPAASSPSASSAAEPGEGGPWTGYAPEPERPPLGTYAVLSSGFVFATGAFVVVKRRERELPDALSARDLALIGTGAFKVSRLLTREKGAAFIRAPFTEYEGKGDAPGELEELGLADFLQVAYRSAVARRERS
ncbi:hypothetical protein BH20ACT19_BH20ACT19_04600 [soil metagenome]